MSRAESKARTRQRLVESATAVFAEKGFNAATIEEIVERAGFTRGAFYANWADKAELMWEIAEAETTRTWNALETAIDAAELDEKLEVLQSWFDGLLQPRPLQPAFNELMHVAGQTEDGRKRQAQSFAAERRFIERVVTEITTILDVELPIPVEHFAAMGFAVGTGLAMQHLVDPDAVPSTLFGDAQAYLWFGVLGAAQSGAFTPRTGTPKRARRRAGDTRS
jgi:AcrR family transcriptional regulator